ncbi:unnamed protein product [Pleuronectes platessa]|uniref:Peptidase S1 domain-containing protein n=1 Tax=Pleuronectes platessa TaxID=8262 RepID=A0A9N7V4L3_PLEPL|nr:unnamed protein product [Pleuronectes platessa]
MLTRHKCGGTILNSLHVLTATHCLTNLKRYYCKYLRVVAGINKLSNQGSGAQIRSIKRIKMHEDFNTRTLDNDVALLRLSFCSSSMSTSNRPAPLIMSAMRTTSTSGTVSSLDGGAPYSKVGDPVNTLQEAEVQLFDRRKCNQISWYPGLITRIHDLCWTGERSGDSGGPLQCYSQTENRFYLVGVSSHGKKCGRPQKPGAYARISRYADWLSSGQTALASSASGLNTGAISAGFTSTPTLLGYILFVIIKHLC